MILASRKSRTENGRMMGKRKRKTKYDERLGEVPSVLVAAVLARCIYNYLGGQIYIV